MNLNKICNHIVNIETNNSQSEFKIKRTLYYPFLIGKMYPKQLKNIMV